MTWLKWIILVVLNVMSVFSPKYSFFWLGWCHAQDLYGSQIPVITGPLEFLIQINLKHDTIAVWNLAQSWSISNYFFVWFINQLNILLLELYSFKKWLIMSICKILIWKYKCLVHKIWGILQNHRVVGKIRFEVC